MNDAAALAHPDAAELAAHQMVLERSALAAREVADSCATIAPDSPVDASIAHALAQLAPVLAGVGDAVADGLDDLVGIVRTGRGAP